MKKLNDEMRAEYKATDFVKLERDKFYSEVAKGSTVRLLQPAVASVVGKRDDATASDNSLPRRSD